MDLPKVDIKHILYTTDFSENSRLVYAFAARIAEQFRAKSTLLHVVQEELLDLLMFDVGIERAAGVEKRLSIMKEHLKDAKDTIIEKIRVECGREAIADDDIVVERGNPVKMILRVAEEKNCDLIVMGKKGRGSLEDTMMGDTVRRVLHRSKVPVLVVQTTDKK